mgnify:CR=1 FL=1
MYEEITLNFEEIKWTYETLDRSKSDDTFNFNFKSKGDNDTEEDFDPEFSKGDESNETDVAIEEMTLAHESINRPHDIDIPHFDDFFG